MLLLRRLGSSGLAPKSPAAWLPVGRASRQRFNTRVGPLAHSEGHKVLRLQLNHVACRHFHVSRRTEALPLWVFALFKSSAGLQTLRLVSQVALTFVPMAFIRGHIAQGIVERHPEILDREKLLHMGAQSSKLAWILLSTPFIIATLIALVSVERTPLTGRPLRLIVLSPSEEEGLAREFQGMGWYQAVAKVLLAESPDGTPPRVIHSSDPRYIWASKILRHLESTIPALQAGIDAPALNGAPHPPRADYPLVPRPRMADRIRQGMEEATSSDEHQATASPHSVFGPYNLLVVERSEPNAFAYGLGGNGSAGIILFTGFFDELLREQMQKATTSPPPPPPAASLWTSLFGAPITPRAAQPSLNLSPDQTNKLAVLLSHELSHLILAHQVEMYGNLFPSMLSWALDILRTVLFPFTFTFGPFLSDYLQKKSFDNVPALRNLHDAEVSKLYELEADVVSARILAYAGFDPRLALEFWQNRPVSEDLPGASRAASSQTSWVRQLLPTGAFNTHPLRQRRIENLQTELDGWSRT
ncbi:hypothetical protein BKA62DRAFT_614067 [Auriculariales sp. MPI-PUGE-AT-0066]|nr:hypothetical protein BKA62DRAFT_614067 [Auriculariales sp. MPI-PUGE-AT-0066]